LAQAIRPSRLRGRPVAEGQHLTRSDLSLHPRHFRGRHHAATIFVIVLLAAVAFRLFPATEVTVLNNGEAFRVNATFDPRGEGLAAASVSLEPGDRVLYAGGGKHASVAVDRASAVILHVDGTVMDLKTQTATVGGALATAGLLLRPGDLVYLNGRLTTARAPLSAATLPPVDSTAASRAGAVEVRIVRARPVTVIVGTLPVQANSPAQDVRGLLAEIGMTVREGDLVRPSLETPLSAGMTVRLAPAKTVNVLLDGKEQSLYTQAQTVADILSLLGVNPGPEELLSLPRETLVTNGMSIQIGLTRVEDVLLEEAIPPPTVHEIDQSLTPGKTRIIPGRDGVQSVKYRYTYKNGVQTGRELIARQVVQPAVPTRHISGPPASGPRPVNSLETPDFQGSYRTKMTVRATWYNASHGGKLPGDPYYGITATGVRLDWGICAVDKTVIPLGTRFFVPGYGQCLAADVGGGVRGNHIDLGFPEEIGDPGWGNRIIDIYILD
jgi:uncharacterized protein YabE (DUF348 family)/3D (Asp-Asp-Asp) domain-containing protein